MAISNLLRTFCFIIILSFAKCEQCKNSAQEFENHLGTKTPYRTVANYNSTELKFEGCKATKLWALVRHGTRNPNVKFINKMSTRMIEIRDLILENLSKATDEINNLDLDLFKSWSSKLREKDEKKLTHEGEDEMLLLAERLQNRFPEVLGNVYSDSSIKFKFTATQRTKKSAQAFAAGLFGRNVVRDVNFPEPLKHDPILRFYKLCNKWRKEISKNPQSLVERTKFENGSVIAKTIEAINERLGLDDDLDLNDIHTMYMVCAFETAWNRRRRSPWCSAFSNDDLKALEYAEDLKYYWVDGYGHELTYKQACPALNDLMEFFKNNGSHTKATVYFTHSGTLLKMLAHMELYKEDKPLTAENYNSNSNRKWRVSQIDSFGSNLIFVLYNCQGEEKILTLHQEHVIRLPSCPDTDLCDLERFTQHYKDSFDCSFDQMCENV